jgi:hypothetical protein
VTRRQVLARYRDNAGMEHALVLTARPSGGLLLLDRSPARVLVVAELSGEEGEAQARAVLRDWPGDPSAPQHSPPVAGYLARARRTAEPLCRALRPDDLAPPASREAPDATERRAA